MKQTSKIRKKPTFIHKNKDILVASGIIVLLVGSTFTWYLMKKRKEKKEKANRDMSNTAMPEKPTSSASPTYQAPSTTNAGYPLKYGSRHPDVKILQRYLKIYKETLGTSGPKRDGIDGVFGSKTSRAAKKRLGKTSFMQKDIAGMRKALLSLGK